MGLNLLHSVNSSMVGSLQVTSPNSISSCLFKLPQLMCLNIVNDLKYLWKKRMKVNFM